MIALAAIIVWQPASANKTEFKRYEHFAYDVDNNSLLELLNHNGNIVIENTDENRLNIEATVTGKARNLDDAERIAQKIKIVVKSDNGKINISNDVPKSLKFEEFDISYVVTMPAWLNINLSNKYGNVVANQLFGKTSVKVSYGSLKIKQLNDRTGGFPTIDLAYCRESEIEDMQLGGINASYSNITVEKGFAVAISSKFSKWKIGSAQSMAIEASYDNYSIAHVGKIDATVKYSDLNINSLQTLSKINSEYGNVNIKKVDRDFSNIDIKTDFGNVSLSVGKLECYSLNLKTKYGNIKTPKLGGVNTETSSSQSFSYNAEHKVRTVKPTNGEPTGEINIRVNYGNINIDN